MPQLFNGNKFSTFAANITLIFCLLAPADALAITYTFTGTGNWNVAGNWDANGIPPSTLPSGSTIIIAPSGTCQLTTDLTIEGGGTFTINAGKQFHAGVFDLTNSGTFNMLGTYNSGAGSNLTNTSTGLITKGFHISVNGTFNNAGTIQDNGGNLTVTGTGNINTGNIYRYGSNEFTIFNGAAFVNSGLIEIHSPSSITSYGTFTNNGTLQCNWFTNGDVGINDPGVFINNGTLMGTGTFEQVGSSTFTNNGSGIIAPGFSPGTLTVEGSASLGSGTYRCEINGTVQGSTYDRIAFTGTATIGSSKLEIVFGYTPTVGATFDIITASSVSGTYSFPANVTFSGGGVLDISLSYPGGNTVRVTVTSALPVELVSFTAKEQDHKVLLNWATASELKNRGFEVQRSGDGKNWDALGFLSGNGTATDAHHYAYLDEKPLPNVNYYRLRQMDFDDKFEFSPIRSVEIKGHSPGDWKVYPNPSHGSFFVETLGEEGVLTLIAPDGKQVLNTMISNENNITSIETTNLPPGLYWLRLKTLTDLFTTKIVVE